MRYMCAVVIGIGLLGQNVFSQNNASGPDSCSVAEQRQFDFWVGVWDVEWPGNKPTQIEHGTNTIRRVLDGCVVEEDFSGGKDTHLRGKSHSIFLPRVHQWKQTWVDNEGSYLDFTGEFKDGQMILTREASAPDGSRFLQRMVWKNIKYSEFDWSWEKSEDNGKSWQVVWPIHYRRKS